MKLIRKISIGPDYKNGAMHYAVGQEVYGGHTIESITETEGSFEIFISKDQEIMPWKKINSNMAATVEYNLDY